MLQCCVGKRIMLADVAGKISGEWKTLQLFSGVVHIDEAKHLLWYTLISAGSPFKKASNPYLFWWKQYLEFFWGLNIFRHNFIFIWNWSLAPDPPLISHSPSSKYSEIVFKTFSTMIIFPNKIWTWLLNIYLYKESDSLSRDSLPMSSVKFHEAFHENLWNNAKNTCPGVRVAIPELFINSVNLLNIVGVQSTKMLREKCPQET